MPITTSTTTEGTRLANTALATTFFPRVLRSVWSRVCGMTKSSSLYEPFAFLGAAPMLKLFYGTMQSTPIQSFSTNVPNPVWKNYEGIKRNQFEFDQTKTLKNRAAWHGVKLAQTWDYLLANQMINGSATGSQNFLNPDDMKSYTLTFDNQPWFSNGHVTSMNTGAPLFSNILTSNGIPTTSATLFGGDLALYANAMQRDIANAITMFASITDQSGALVYPDLDPERQLVVVVPPCLSTTANLAFRTSGTLAGSNGSTSGSTTNIGKTMVKDVITFSLLQGCPNIIANPQQLPGTAAGQIAPTYATTWYIFLDDDFIKPVYFQRFEPLEDTIPAGYDVEAETNRILKAAKAAGGEMSKVNTIMANLFASAEVNTNLDALGNNAQIQTAIDETFFFSSRTRGMIFPGPWTSSIKVDPVGINS